MKLYITKVNNRLLFKEEKDVILTKVCIRYIYFNIMR